MRNPSTQEKALSNIAILKVVQLLERLYQYTVFQVEDQWWFLGRAFKFTSRTASNFIGAIARNHTSSISGLSYVLCGATLRAGTKPLTNDIPRLEEELMIKWKGMAATIGIANRDTDFEVTIGTAERFMSATTSSPAQMRKE